MFGATSIGSEETLPTLTELTQADYERDMEMRTVTERSQLRSRHQRGSRPPNYGCVPTPNLIEYRYPRAVYFILATKFFETFTVNGIRTVLALYLCDGLNFTENFSTIMLHIFNFFGHFYSIFGAILADSCYGNVKTISGFSYLYAFGCFFLTISSMPHVGVPLALLVFIALLFIGVGNGSIRACITSIGALQFKMPEQAVHLAQYFSFYYFVYYFGIFLSKILPPLVRVNTQCFDKPECYPAVFGTLGAAFLVAWVIFLIGKVVYLPENVYDDSVLFKFYGCIKTALLEKWRRRKSEERCSYWLYNAIGPYDEEFVNDVSKVLRITKLFIPLPFYFALLAQQDSSWTFQATMMNTTFLGVNIQPDQFKAVGPVFLFILIPLCQYVTTPLLKRAFNWELQPLQSVAVGGICSAGAYICAGVLQEHIAYSPSQSVNIAWQLPQFLLLMLAELLLSIAGLQFAFTQAPRSMKSVVMAAWFLNNAFGNLIVVIVTQLQFLNFQKGGFFFYAAAMLICIIIFGILAFQYARGSGLQAPQEQDRRRLQNFKCDLDADDVPSCSSRSTGV
ncbi:peptide transporter family 1-like [Scaptodrosophila lebanonensis]|uniref:Peptide transporter family 1-like n=1 Tax=Drosophila lebanonensis TaxID=7225 RepID=A0A6J2TIK0_DROLE|nr:peptide transporter family 1-like [Scaptodrosophila lebanonensis]